jgi:hypothetical protein
MALKERSARALHALKQLPAKARAAREHHQERHRPTGFSFLIGERIALMPAAWDALTAKASVCMSRGFLELLEQAGPEGLRTHYALVADGEGKPLAAVSCQSLTVDGAAVPSKSTPTKLKEARDKGLSRLKQRVLVCGNLLGWGPQGIAFAEGVAQAEVWPGILEALYRIRRADGLFGPTGLVMVKDLAAEDWAAGDDPLRRFSYRPLETEPNMIIRFRPEWTDFEAYLGAMKSDYRSGIKKQIRDVEAAGLVLERLDAAGVAAHAEELHRLYHEVHDRQKLRLVSISKAWLPSLAARYGKDFTVTVIRRPGQDGLLGFISTLKDRDGAIGYYIGFDKAEASTGVPLYLRLLYALVEDALAMGAAWASLGRTALAPKAKLGAEGQPLRCYLRHRIPALNTVVQGLLRNLPEPEQPPERSPFKPAKK